MNASDPEYYGTMVAGAAVNSTLPVLYWYTPNPEKSTSVEGLQVRSVSLWKIRVRNTGQEGGAGGMRPLKSTKTGLHSYHWVALSETAVIGLFRPDTREHAFWAAIYML